MAIGGVAADRLWRYFRSLRLEQCFLGLALLDLSEHYFVSIAVVSRRPESRLAAFSRMQEVEGAGQLASQADCP